MSENNEPKGKTIEIPIKSKIRHVLETGVTIGENGPSKLTGQDNEQ